MRQKLGKNEGLKDTHNMPSTVRAEWPDCSNRSPRLDPN